MSLSLVLPGLFWVVGSGRPAACLFEDLLPELGSLCGWQGRLPRWCCGGLTHRQLSVSCAGVLETETGGGKRCYCDLASLQPLKRNRVQGNIQAGRAAGHDLVRSRTDPLG